VKVRHLSDGMNTRIRPARADDPALHAGHPADGLFDPLLDGETVFLMLPAAIIGAVIFYAQSDVSHDSWKPSKQVEYQSILRVVVRFDQGNGKGGGALSGAHESHPLVCLGLDADL